MSSPATRLTAGRLLPWAFVGAAAVEVLWRDWGRPRWLVVGLLGSVLLGVLAWRRTRPLLAMTVYAASGVLGSVIQTALPDPTSRTTDVFMPIIALLVLSYSLAAYGDRRAVLLGAPQPVVLVVLVDLLEPESGEVGTGALFAGVILAGGPLLAGWLVRSRAALLDDLRRTEERVAREHRDRLRAARAREALRVWERLSAELSDGLGRIGRAAAAARADGTLAHLESTARTLLARTRTTVVDLATTPAPVEGEEDPRGDAPGRPERVDAESALGWTMLIASGTALTTLLPTRDDWTATGVGLTAAAVVALAFAWRHTLACVLAAWAATVGYDRWVADLGSDRFLTVPLLVVATPFLLGWLERRWPATLGLFACLAGAVSCAHSADRLGAVVLGVLAWVAGRGLRSRSVLLSQVRAAHERLGRERDEELRAIVLEERAALARDVHDAVGHSLTVLALQAGAARRLATSDPAACAQALATVTEVARDAAAQLDGSSGPGDLAALVDGARRAGVEVTVAGAEALDGLPDCLRHTTHRLVQESLTNAMRHAPGAAVLVRLDEDGDALAVSVRNGPAGRPPELAGAGTGLRGLAERIAALGGELSAGPAPDGGFLVAARLPTRSGPVAAEREPVG